MDQRAAAYLTVLETFDKVYELMLDFYKRHGYWPDQIQLSHADRDVLQKWLPVAPRVHDPELPVISTLYGLPVLCGEHTCVLRLSQVPEELLWKPEVRPAK